MFTNCLLQHGGTFVQNPGPQTFCVLVQKLIVRANNIIRYMLCMYILMQMCMYAVG